MEHVAPRLVLHPQNPQRFWQDRQPIVGALQSHGVIGKALDTSESAFHVGPRFLDFVCFLGCSPVISAGRDPNGPSGAGCGTPGDLVHFRVPTASAEVRFLCGANTSAPRCPHCRQIEPDWRGVLDAWSRNGTGWRWSCPSCSRKLSIYALDWRRSAGFARAVIEIWGIHPAEAVPDDSLLRLLAERTGASFDYFYLQGSEG
jgi:hypothetical protein